MIKVNSVKALMEGMRSEIPKFANVALEHLGEYILKAVKEDYGNRVQRNFFPLKDPVSKQVISKMEPQEIAKSVEKFIEGMRTVVYIPQGTLADQEGRRQELFGGKSWQKIRGEMQDLNKVNEILAEIGLKGFKAKTVV